ncbi:MAG: ADP compounds hydrolase NudE [Gammaproteobacteria bacterium]
MSKIPKITKITTLAQTRFFCIEGVDLEFSNGATVTYERLNTKGVAAVLIVAMLDDNTVLLIREYAGGVHRYELCCPKGKIEPGEEILAAANREIKEEVGYGAGKLEFLKSMTSGPGYSNHVTHVVLATELYEEQLAGDEPEPLEVVSWKLSELESLIQQEDVTEARTIAALFLVREKFKKQFNTENK